ASEPATAPAPARKWRRTMAGMSVPLGGVVRAGLRRRRSMMPDRAAIARGGPRKTGTARRSAPPQLEHEPAGGGDGVPPGGGLARRVEPDPLRPPAGHVGDADGRPA